MPQIRTTKDANSGCVLSFRAFEIAFRKSRKRAIIQLKTNTPRISSLEISSTCFRVAMEFKLMKNNKLAKNMVVAPIEFLLTQRT